MPCSLKNIFYSAYYCMCVELPTIQEFSSRVYLIAIKMALFMVYLYISNVSVDIKKYTKTEYIEIITWLEWF